MLNSVRTVGSILNIEIPVPVTDEIKFLNEKIFVAVRSGAKPPPPPHTLAKILYLPHSWLVLWIRIQSDLKLFAGSGSR